MSLWGTIKASIKSYATGKPTNSMVRPAAVFEPNLALWVKHFILNSTQERILHHSEGKKNTVQGIDPPLMRISPKSALAKYLANANFG